MTLSASSGPSRIAGDTPEVAEARLVAGMQESWPRQVSRTNRSRTPERIPPARFAANDENEINRASSLIDGKKQQLKKSSVKERINAPSPMPPGLAEVLGKRNLRDVIEFLATVKQ